MFHPLTELRSATAGAASRTGMLDYLISQGEERIRNKPESLAGFGR
jgi:hypothetical protein